MRRRPAETTTAAAGLAYLIAYLAGATDDPTLLVSLTVVLAALPAGVTAAVERYRKLRGP